MAPATTGIAWRKCLNISDCGLLKWLMTIRLTAYAKKKKKKTALKSKNKRS